MRTIFFHALRVGGLLASACLATGCYHYYVKPERVSPATEWRSETQVALLWGLLQPEDIAPANCPRGVPLAEVNANTNLGYVLLGALTLGIVLPHELAWRCAKLPSGEPPDVVHAPLPPRGMEVSDARAVRPR